MKHLMDQFREFAFKGNMIDLALAVIIGGAFGKVISALVDNVIMPALSYLTGSAEPTYTQLMVGRIEVGAFIGALVNFLVIALALFLILKKLVPAIEAQTRKEEAAPPPPTKKECPKCFSEIDIRATRCPACATDL